MPWQLAIFTVLGVGLVAGFAWYERVRPDARTVALVGTLAALAALGRLAFAAVPNVKPTTDIVLISGFALGAAPGYAVGAVAALSSNFFFGQGPWTPWQMAGWGLVGVAGALLARVGRGRIGRVPLAASCFAAGLAFTALQDVGDWVTYSDHSAAALGAYVGSGLGFDLIHAIGCVAFALAFGQPLLRSLRRFRARTEVHWLSPPGARGHQHSPLPPPAAIAAAVAGAAAMLGFGLSSGRAAATPAASAGTASAATAVSYLRSAQNADGGFGSAAGQPSSPMVSGWAILALAAAGERPAQIRTGPGERTALDYLRAHAHGADVGALERTILAARAAGVDPAQLGGVNLVRALSRRVGRDGSVARQVNLTAFAILALRAAGRAPAATAYRWLAAQQDADGGFGFASRGQASDVDDTGAALEALATAPPRLIRAQAATVQRAIEYLRERQRRNGGFPEQAGEAPNAQSTAFAAQGLLAVGVGPSGLQRGSRSPLDYLRSLGSADGAIRYGAGQLQTPTWVTAEAQLALSGRPLPVLPGQTGAPGASYRRALAARSGSRASAPRRAGTPSPRPPARASLRAHRGPARPGAARARRGAHGGSGADRRRARRGTSTSARGDLRDRVAALMTRVGEIERILIAIPQS